MIRYGRTPWLDQFPKSRVPSYPRYRGSSTKDVVIVGGGLTGCATAYAFAAAGIPVHLLEADAIGRGATAAAAGWIADDPGVSFVEVEKMLGLREARHAFNAWRRAALDFAALLRRLDIKCHLEPRSAVTIARTPEEASRLAREIKARKAAGVDTPTLAARAVSAEVALTAASAIRGRDGATLDPYRACVGLAAAAEKRGARLFERSPVKRITFGRKWADVYVAGGVIRTRRVAITTGVPTWLFKSLARHFRFRSAFFAFTEPVPAKVRHQLGHRSTVVRDSAVPPHIVRWVDDERLLVVGADAESAPERQREKRVVQRTGQLMYELSTLYPDVSGILPAYGWQADYCRTAEGLPYIGPHRNFPHHLFAFGDSSHSLTGSYLASRILLRYYLDRSEPADRAFEFTR